MEERRDTYAYFWIEGFQCDPEQISHRLGMSPTEVNLKGELLAGNRVRDKNSWSIASPLARGDEFIDSHLEALLELIAPHAPEIKAIAQECEIGINCVGYFYSSHPGFHLSRELIQSLSVLELSVDFDLYNYCSKCDCEEPL